jgi:hypothetical protein
MSIVDRLCSALERGDSTAQAEAVQAAAALFEKAGGRGSADSDDQLSADGADAESLTRLRESLASFVERHIVAPPLSSAIWALGLTANPELRPLFVRCLQEHASWGADTGVLYQSMMALQNLGERIFPDGRSSLKDVERNLKLASEFLQKNVPPSIQGSG